MSDLATVDMQQVSPFHCAMCMNSSGTALDLGIDYPVNADEIMRGAILLCDSCVNLVARFKGYCKPEEIKLDAPVIDEDTMKRFKEIKNDLGSFISLIRNIDSIAPTLDRDKEAAEDGFDSIIGQSDDAVIDEDSNGISSSSSDESESESVFAGLGI